MSDAPIKFGANCWEQYTDWADLREAGIRADRLGFDSLWTWDHLYPDRRRPSRPDLRGLADPCGLGRGHRAAPRSGSWSARTRSATRRSSPSMVTTLDHISNGRAILGIGGAWFETEHDGLRDRVRLRRRASGCAGWTRRSRSCAACSTATRRPVEQYYNADGRAERAATGPGRTCRSSSGVAGSGRRCASLPSTPTPATSAAASTSVKRKDEILRRHCEEVGRDESEIERTVGAGTRDHPRRSRAKRSALAEAMFAHNGNAEPWRDQPVGTLDESSSS